MEQEINISGRIITKKKIAHIDKGEHFEYPFGNFAFRINAIANGKIIVTTQEDIPEPVLAEFCKAASKEFEGKVYIWKNCEDYGNANVFNGGSDYEVVNETCFLCICEKGRSLCQERTNHWNEKIDEVL